MTSFTVVFDFETGGVEPQHPSIQLAAIAVDAEWNEVASFNRRIKFDASQCDPAALEMNHYTAEAWADAIPPVLCATQFARWLRPYQSVSLLSKRTGRPYTVAQMAGYNTPFDQPRLKALFGSSFMPCAFLMRDVLQRVLWHFDEHGAAPENFKLTTVAAALGLDATGAHDALTDVRLTAAVYRAIRP